MLGFAAKEAALEALLHGDTADRWELAVVVLGSVLTVAYTLRFVWGAFARKRGVADTPAHRVGAALLAPPAVLAVAGLVLGPGVGWTDRLFAAYADVFPAPAHPYHLALWHGFGTALLLSAVTWAGGAALFAARGTVTKVSRRVAWPTADNVFGHVLLGLERVALQVTGFVQRGSLSGYLAITMSVMLAGQLAVLVTDRPWEGAVAPRVWDVPLQGAVAFLTCAAALSCLTVSRRMKAVVLAGLTGYGAALLFVVQGAPDLALTQFCVETVSMIVFVLVLRRLPVRFEESIGTWRRALRIPVALGAAATVGVAVWAAGAARVAEPAGAAMVEEVAHHGLKDVVATILVDLRAWDTMGESAVLAAAAIGVTSLIYLHRRGEASMNREELRGRPPGRCRADASPDCRRATTPHPNGAGWPPDPLSRPSTGPSSSRWWAASSSTPSWCSPCTCCSARRTCQAADSSPGWWRDSPSSPATSREADSSSRRPRPCSRASSPGSDCSCPRRSPWAASRRARCCTPGPTTDTCPCSVTTT